MTTHGKTSAMLATRNLQHDLSQLVPIHVAYPSIRVWGPGTRSYLEVRGLRRRNSRLHTGAFFKGWPKDRPVKGPTKRPGSFQNSEKGRCRRDGFGSSWKTISRCVCVCVGDLLGRPPRSTLEGWSFDPQRVGGFSPQLPLLPSGSCSGPVRCSCCPKCPPGAPSGWFARFTSC